MLINYILNFLFRSRVRRNVIKISRIRVSNFYVNTVKNFFGKSIYRLIPLLFQFFNLINGILSFQINAENL